MLPASQFPQITKNYHQLLCPWPSLFQIPWMSWAHINFWFSWKCSRNTFCGSWPNTDHFIFSGDHWYPLLQGMFLFFSLKQVKFLPINTMLPFNPRSSFSFWALLLTFHLHQLLTWIFPLLSQMDVTSNDPTRREMLPTTNLLGRLP